jgi:hypothetical protein
MRPECLRLGTIGTRGRSGTHLHDNPLGWGPKVVGGHGPILADITTWGWVHMIPGAIIAVTGAGLFVGSSAARWSAIFFVAVIAVAQIVWSRRRRYGRCC